MKNAPFVIDLLPVRSERLSPQDYLKLMAENPRLVERAEFVPPSPGVRGFGSFVVRYTRPRHRQVAHG